VKNTQVALIICATIIAVFPIISNTTIGLRSVESGHQNLFAINHATRLQSLIYLRIPSALPFFFAGLRIASGLALIGAVVAEFVAGTGGRSAGLAYEILQSGFQLDIPRMFAALFLITVTGIRPVEVGARPVARQRSRAGRVTMQMSQQVRSAHSCESGNPVPSCGKGWVSASAETSGNWGEFPTNNSEAQGTRFAC
jgi:hypothetical protein